MRGKLPNKGDRVRCIKMVDPYPIEPGTEGTVVHIDGIGQIHVDWDDGRGLALIPDTDEFEIISDVNEGRLSNIKHGSRLMKTDNHNIIKTFELYRDTYYKAANKARFDHKQPKRADIISKHGDEMGIYRHSFIPEYKMDIYLHFAIGVNTGAEDELYPDKVIKDVMVEDYFELHDHNIGAFLINTDEYHFNISIELNPNDVNIVLFDTDNKFANRRSANKFIRLMHEFYKAHDPNTKGRVLSKLNDVEHMELTYRDVDDNNFWGFLHRNGYDWEKFRKSIDINSLWDSYTE